jgi:peptidoglycan/xylan/chitin deacetylase (PgdA/CDA1 family)
MLKIWLHAAALVALSLSTARAAECGPDTLGVSRTLKVGTQGGLEVGWKTYPDTLPLADHEVILTFDDGPDPQTTPLILNALKAQCVRATFFAIGRKVDDAPKLTRREVEEGHNVAFHTYTHPQPTLRYMGAAVARADILKGVLSVERAAYGQTFPDGEPDDLSKLKLHAPFFRYPGFADTGDLNAWFAANGVAVFGVDLWASDWIRMTPDQELKLILSRLDRARKGMLLFHDDKPWTAAMLPKFLAELKARGYRIVQIEAAPGHGPTEKAPPGWRSETGRTIDSIRPRFEKAATKAGTSFPVKPAPQE